MENEEFTKTDLWGMAVVNFITYWPAVAGGLALGNDERYIDSLFGVQSITSAVAFTGCMMIYNWYTKMRGKNKNAHNQGELKAAKAPKALEPARQYSTIDDVVKIEEEKVLKL